MKKKWNTDRIISFTAIFLSFLSLFFLIYEINLTRKHNRLSVTPRVHFDSQYNLLDTVETFTFRLENRGLGPAIIDSMAIVYQGIHRRANFGNFLREFYPDLELRTMSTASLPQGSTLIANSSVELLKIIPTSFKDPQFLKLYQEMTSKTENDLYLEVYYKSIYEEKWYNCSKAECTYPEAIK